MSVNKISEDELERRLNLSYWSGRSCGLQVAADTIRQKAGAAFSRQRDDEAVMLRRLADEMAGLAHTAERKRREFLEDE